MIERIPFDGPFAPEPPAAADGFRPGQNECRIPDCNNPRVGYVRAKGRRGKIGNFGRIGFNEYCEKHLGSEPPPQSEPEPEPAMPPGGLFDGLQS